MEALLAQLRSRDPLQAEQACAQLTAVGEKVVPALQEMAKAEDTEARWWAIRCLADIPNSNTTQIFVLALDDEDEAVRQCAALALSRQPDPIAVPKLMLMLNGEDGFLARLAGDALIATGTDAVPALIAGVEAGTGAAQAEAARCLAHIGDTRAVPALFKLLDSPSAIVEHWASHGLEKMGVGMSFFQA